MSLDGPSESFLTVLTLAIPVIVGELQQLLSSEPVILNGAHQEKMAQSFRTEFMQIPVVTRVYVTACILTTIAVVSGYTPECDD